MFSYLANNLDIFQYGVYFFFLDVQKVTSDLKPHLPSEPPADPLYIDMVDGHMVVPSLLFQGQDVPKSSSPGVVEKGVCGTIQEVEIENYDDEEEVPSNSTRFDWKLTTVRKLLNILEDKKKNMGNDFVLTKKVWPEIEREMTKSCKSSAACSPSAIQCREKFYSLKRAYRKYLSDCKKTGNRRPKPFLYENEMELILEGDPAFKPVYLRSSLGLDVSQEIPDEESKSSSSSENVGASSEGSTSVAVDHDTKNSSSRKRKGEDLKEYLEKRDKQFLDTLKEMQNQNNELLRQLIDKLG
jgi:hypothetical protein